MVYLVSFVLDSNFSSTLTMKYTLYNFGYTFMEDTWSSFGDLTCELSRKCNSGVDLKLRSSITKSIVTSIFWKIDTV